MDSTSLVNKSVTSITIPDESLLNASMLKAAITGSKLFALTDSYTGSSSSAIAS